LQALDDLLAISAWMQRLDPAQQQRVRAETIERRIPAGGFVCRKGEPVEHWIGVIDGLVKISSVSADGRSMTFAGIPPGGWFGEGSLLKREPRRYDGIVLGASRVALMPRATFDWLLDQSIAFNRHLLLMLNERLGQFIATVEFDRLLSPDVRVARYLAQLFNPLLYPASDSRLQISQSELGFLTGLSRQRVNQALHALEQRGLLEVGYGVITVSSVEALRTLEA
jgi:CRP/FNR family transcriptional regulator, cyclic AMP receptor protein